MPYYGQNNPAGIVLQNAAPSTFSNLATAGIKAGTEVYKTKANASSKWAKRALTLGVADSTARAFGYNDIVDSLGKGAQFVGDRAADIASSYGATDAVTDTLHQIAGKTGEAAAKASDVYQKAALNLHLQDDLKALFKGATKEGKLLDDNLITRLVNKGKNTTGESTYLDELGGLGVGALAAYGLVKGGKALMNRHIYKADRKAEHQHDIDLARELKKVDTGNLLLHGKAKNLRG